VVEVEEYRSYDYRLLRICGFYAGSMQSISLYRVETVPVPITTSQHHIRYPEWRWGAEGECTESEGAESEGAGTAKGVLQKEGCSAGVQRCRDAGVQGCRG
jgi:hypothetical protein